MELLETLLGIASIASVCLNIIQYRHRAELMRALRARSQATYNCFFMIAHSSDSIRALEGAEGQASQELLVAISRAYNITGLADAARSEIIAFSREHLRFLPVEEHPAHPILDKLPSPGTLPDTPLRQAPPRERIPDSPEPEPPEV